MTVAFDEVGRKLPARRRQVEADGAPRRSWSPWSGSSRRSLQRLKRWHKTVSPPTTP